MMNRPTIVSLSVALLCAVQTASAAQRLRPVMIDDINFPDETFRNFIAETYDESKDGMLTAQEIYHAKVMASSALSEVSSFEGIDNLIALETIECRGNYFVTKLDFHGMPNLKNVVCSDNFYLSAVDVSGCPKLESIECLGNDHLSSINLDNATALKKLVCVRSALHELDLRGCKALENIDCSGNEAMRTIDLTNLENLKSLKCCKQPAFTVVNLSGCKNLEKLICFENKNLTNLDIAHLDKLIKLDCSRNNLASINVGGCKALEALDCYGNAHLKTVDVSGLRQLRKLNCSNCAVANLKIDNCPVLEVLDCYNLRIKSLDLSKTPTVKDLSCSGADYSQTLTIKGYEKLERIACKGNVDVDFANMPNLRELYCGLVGVQQLDVRKCSSLELLDCSDNVGIKSINATDLQSLKKLICYNSAVSKIDITNCQSLKMLFCYGCPNLTEIAASDLTNLSKVVCSNCNISKLGLRNTPELTVLNAGHNHIESLDLATCTKLKNADLAGQTRHLTSAKATKKNFAIHIDDLTNQEIVSVKINDADAKFEVVRDGKEADILVSRSKYTEDKDDIVAYTLTTGRNGISMIVEVKIDKLVN